MSLVRERRRPNIIEVALINESLGKGPTLIMGVTPDVTRQHVEHSDGGGKLAPNDRPKFLPVYIRGDVRKYGTLKFFSLVPADGL